MFKKIFIVLSFPLFLFSCEEINELSEELKILKSNQDIILKQQSDLIKKLGVGLFVTKTYNVHLVPSSR